MFGHWRLLVFKVLPKSFALRQGDFTRKVVYEGNRTVSSFPCRVSAYNIKFLITIDHQHIKDIHIEFANISCFAFFQLFSALLCSAVVFGQSISTING